MKRIVTSAFGICLGAVSGVILFELPGFIIGAISGGFIGFCIGSGYLESSDIRKQDVYDGFRASSNNSAEHTFPSKEDSVSKEDATAATLLKPVFDALAESGHKKDATVARAIDDDNDDEQENKNSFAVVQRPTERLDDVAGMDYVKEQFYEMVIMPLREPELYKKYGIQAGGGILLYGPPGTGKTYIVRALAGELEAAFYAVKSSDIISQYVGESEKNLKKLFAEARKNKLSVVFMDEIDSLAQDRSKNVRNYETQFINALLAELDGFSAKGSKNSLLFIGATNRPDTIDGALLRPGRFDVKIKVGLPDFSARRKISELFFAKRKISIAGEMLDYIANNTENYNCADVDNVAEQITKALLKGEITAKMNRKSEKVTINTELVNKVLAKTKSSVLQRDLAAIEKWEQNQGI